MPKGYWIALVDVKDGQAYDAYRREVGPFLQAQKARFLVRGGKREVKEGALRERTIVIEFEDYAAALACYESDEYSRIRALRERAAIVDLMVVEGV